MPVNGTNKSTVCVRIDREYPRVDRAYKNVNEGNERNLYVEGRRSQGNPEEGDFVVRAPKGSITKMIGSAIGGDDNCVNRVIITNLEAISSRPDQSEDASPFPEQGPLLSFLVSDFTLPTVIEFLSSSFSNPESHSPRRRRHRRRRHRCRRCISVVVSLCDTRKFTLVPFRLHSRIPRFFCLVPRFVWRPFSLSLLSLSLSLSASPSFSYCVKRLPGALGRNDIGESSPALFSRVCS